MFNDLISILVDVAVIDEGELNWKIVAISFDDPKASLVNGVEKHFLCLFSSIMYLLTKITHMRCCLLVMSEFEAKTI